MWNPLTPKVAALLADGLTIDTTYGNDTGPSVGIVDADGCDIVRLFQPEEDGACEAIDGPWYAVQLDACNERGAWESLYEGPDEDAAVAAYCAARDRYQTWVTACSR